MGLESRASGGESRFAAYVEAIAAALGHADRAAPFRSYCAGLLLPGDRKSVEPMAARVQPGRVQAAHQSLHHFVAKADWSDDTVLAAVRARVQPVIEQRGPIRALIIDDTGLPKKGKQSVGVARQYCGQLGKQDNCQVAVSLSAANDHASLPIAYRLYLPHEWADDPDRRAQAGVPDDVVFQTKPQIALDQLRAALVAGIEAEVALLDAGYGNDTDLRDGITEIGLAYVVGIQSSTSLWPPGVQPLPPKQWSGRGRPTSAIRRDTAHQPISAKQLAAGLPKKAWRRVTWREGSNAKLASRFAAVRVRPAHRDYHRATPRPEEWCLIEWPADNPSRRILAVHAAREHQPPCPGKHRKVALADRAGLPRPEAGTRARPLRGARMAWLPPSRHAVHRRLRIPDLRKGSDSPLRTTQRPSRQGTSRSRRLSTPRIPRPDLNATSRTQSHLSVSASPAPLLAACRDAHAASTEQIV